MFVNLLKNNIFRAMFVHVNREADSQKTQIVRKSFSPHFLGMLKMSVAQSLCRITTHKRDGKKMNERSNKQKRTASVIRIAGDRPQKY